MFCSFIFFIFFLLTSRHKTQSGLNFNFLFKKKIEKKKELHHYHSQGVKIELQFQHLFIRSSTHNLPLYYITNKFFYASSCGGLLKQILFCYISIILTDSSFFFSPILGSFFWVRLLSFHSYGINILVDGVNIVLNVTLMSSYLQHISF